MTALTQAQFARHIGVDRAHVTRLKHTGRLVMTPDGERVLVAESEARIAATADPGKAPVAERHAAARAAAVDAGNGQKTAQQDMAEKTAMTYQQARAVRERYAALHAKAEYEARIGKLVDADLARAAAADIGVLFRIALESWPDTVGPLLVVKDHATIRAILVEHAEILLHNLSAEIKSMLPERTHEN